MTTPHDPIHIHVLIYQKSYQSCPNLLVKLTDQQKFKSLVLTIGFLMTQIPRMLCKNPGLVWKNCPPFDT